MSDGVFPMPSAFLIEGCITGLFVIANGIYVIVYPPFGDEPQGYAILAIGIFILLATLRLDRTGNGNGTMPPQQ
jgi:hypothetical protein